MDLAKLCVYFVSILLKKDPHWFSHFVKINGFGSKFVCR